MIAKEAWTEEFIRGIIEKCHTEKGAFELTDGRPNRFFLWRMLVAIYDRQKPDEKTDEHTKHNNGKGFTPADAKILSNIAKRSLKYKSLTPKQCEKIVAPRMLKYAGQLVKAIKEKEAAATAAKQAEINAAEEQYDADYAQYEAEMEKAAYLHKMPLM